jgi:hypothetical protein
MISIDGFLGLCRTCRADALPLFPLQTKSALLVLICVIIQICAIVWYVAHLEFMLLCEDQTLGSLSNSCNLQGMWRAICLSRRRC